jgi:hypothetical protein
MSHCRIITNDELERSRKQAAMTLLIYYPGFCLEELMKSTEHLV